MKSICIKTNNSNYIDYIFSSLSDSSLTHICFCQRKFSSYSNLIIHYTGNDNNRLFSEISSILSSLILDCYEEQYIKSTLNLEYSYFESNEIKDILSECFYNLGTDENNNINVRYEILYNIFYEYVSNEKSIFLDGFITFRLKNYQYILNEIMETSINKFLIEKEYNEFISIVKLYINTTPPSSNSVHVIYSKDKTIILDENECLLSITENMYNSKYISDISFSTNDYILNVLLNLLPKKIFLHCAYDSLDDFLLTLKLSFEDKIEFCTDCDLCKKYISSSTAKERRH